MYAVVKLRAQADASMPASNNNVNSHTVSQKNLDPFSFEHNFGKYCPILIIRLLLQTEINCDQL